MGLLRKGLAVCFILAIFYYLRTLFEEKLPLVLDGYYDPEFKPLADVFR